MIDDKFKDLAHVAIDLVDGVKRTGIKIMGLRDRYCKLLMPLEGNINHVGMMYAGSLFTIGELPGGLIVLASYDFGKYVPIVKEVTIRFVSPAKTDVTLELEWTKAYAEALEKEVLKNGKADFTLDMEIKDGGGEVVSMVSGIWQIRPLPEGNGNPFV
ncbi:MAG: DUF4442 domain-containing protein [Deltaproteobacteria bacterium]|nr:DUF4442 domain-containing protein [Deltaproteobacteria bacterium]